MVPDAEAEAEADLGVWDILWLLLLGFWRECYGLKVVIMVGASNGNTGFV